MTILFLFALFVLIYAFIGYPLCLRIAARLFGKQAVCDNTLTPSVSILLSVYNEEQVIRQKIENFLALDYPEDCIELIVISDGCTDQTEEIVNTFKFRQIRLIIQGERGGKTLALNRGVQDARGDILVFTDANSMFRSDSIRRLVSPFADPTVGLVSGRSMYIDERGGETIGGLYRCYEEWIKEGESQLFSIVGADGAIYALRHAVYKPLKSEYINDFLHPILIVLDGFRAVNESLAVVIELVEGDSSSEFSRQTRIMAQSWHICLAYLGQLIQNKRYGYVWQIVSHKLIRWLSLPLLFVLGICSVFGFYDLFYMLSFFCIMSFCILGWLGSKGVRGIASVVWLFFVLHYAAIVGLVRLMAGEKFVTWTPRN